MKLCPDVAAVLKGGYRLLSNDNRKIMKLHLIVFLLGCFIAASCASVKTTPAFESSKVNHKTVAILPVNVSLARAKPPKGMSQDQIRSLQEEERYRYQQEIFDYLNEGKVKKKLSIDLQSPGITNAKLKEHNLSGNWESLDPKVVAEALGVDAVMIIDLDVAFISSNSAALVVMALTPFVMATKEIAVDFKIVTKDIHGIAWNYSQPLRGGVGSSTKYMEDLVYSKIAKRIPYKRNTIQAK